MKINVETITPDIAKQWLTKNVNNRKLRSATCAKYARDIKQGNWRLTHQGIAFDKSGNLVDGQHRLQAIIQAGMPVPMVVAYGSDRAGIDQLAPRSQFDAITIGGLCDWVSDKHVQTARQMMQYLCDRPTSTPASAHEVVRFCELNKDALLFCDSFFTSSKKGVSSALVRSVITTGFYHYPHEDLRSFVKTLYTGVIDDPVKSAAVKVRDMLMSIETLSGQSSRVSTIKKMQRGLDAYMRRQEMQRLIEPKTFLFTVPEVRR